MTFERSITIKCDKDGCSNTIERSHGSNGDLEKAARRRGWWVVHRTGKRKHHCPDCYDGERP